MWRMQAEGLKAVQEMARDEVVGAEDGGRGMPGGEDLAQGSLGVSQNVGDENLQWTQAFGQHGVPVALLARAHGVQGG